MSFLFFLSLDGTNEYVKGSPTETIDGIHQNGLQVSVVLIGVHDTSSGVPVMGVVNQPFHSTDVHGNWKGRVVWGVATDKCSVACVPRPVKRVTGQP